MLYGNRKGLLTEEERQTYKEQPYLIAYCPIVFVFSDDIDLLDSVREHVVETWGIPLTYSRLDANASPPNLQLRFTWRTAEEDMDAIIKYLDSLA